jgi:murein DD-endopeptidase MepM/ murein hydrolase activator NlpD
LNRQLIIFPPEGSGDPSRIPTHRSAFGLLLRVMLGSFAILFGTAIGPWSNEPAARVQDEELAFVAYAERPAAVPQPPPVAAVPEVAAAPVPAATPPPAPVEEARTGLEVLTGTIRRGTSLAGLLAENGVPKDEIQRIAKAIRPRFDFRKTEVGDSFLLTRTAAGELVSFEYQHGRVDVFRVLPAQGGRLEVTHREAPAERRVARVGGVIEKSLVKSILDQGERSELVEQFADIFVWQLDFGQDSQPGDEYRLVFEKFYDAQGFVRYGKILAAQYVTPETDLTAIYYENQRGHGDYYTPSGRSLRRSFLRAPLRFTRISSGYARVRLHPVLNKWMPHEAIDYAAAVGTPVWAVAEGKVIYRGSRGSLGRTVAVEHGNGCVTYYGHLSRYGEAVQVGSSVRQRRVVGYVGSSGVVTGPHLHFTMKCRGRFVDPNKWSAGAGPDDGLPIRMEELFAFEKVKQGRMAELRIASPPLILEAAM